MPKPFAVLLLVLLAAGLALAGCRPARSSATTRTLVYGTTERFTDVDPAHAYDFPTLEILQNVHQGLMACEPGTTNLVPALAASYAANHRGDEFTFKLRRNLRFPDGTPLNAAAVKWSVDRAARLQGDSSWLVTDFVRQVDVVDDHSVRFTLKQPTAFFPALVACAPYFPVSPSAYPADAIAHDPGELKGGRLSGLGPYQAVSFKRDEGLVLEANTSYQGPRPGVQRILIRVFADAAAMRAALERGEIDLVFRGLRPADIEAVSSQSGITVHRSGGPQIRYLCFETSQSVFRDRRLRQAIAALVDRRQLVEQVHPGRAVAAYSMVPAGMAHHVPSFKDAYGEAPDLARADDLLLAAGYTAAAPLRFELWHAPGRYGEADARAAEALKGQLEKSQSVRVTVRGADWPTYKDQWRRRQMPAWLLGWYPDYADADAYTAPLAGTAGSAGVGINFSSTEWDRWFAVEQQSLDPQVRRQAFETLQRAWAEEVPTIPLWQGDLRILARSRVKNVKVSFPLSLDYRSLELE